MPLLQFCNHGDEEDDANKVANDYLEDSPLLLYLDNTIESMAVHENSVSH